MEIILLDRCPLEYSMIHMLYGEITSHDGLQGGESELTFTENLLSSNL
jgi:hypothetical protein